MELSLNELMASWWEGTLQRDHVVFGLRWYWWALAGKTLAGLCLILACLDLVGSERLSKFSNWLRLQAEASTLKRIFNHWRIARSVKLYYDSHFARLPTEDALERMDADAEYMALTESMENNFDQIEWKRLIPWSLCLALVFVFSFYLENSLLLLVGIIAVNLPTSWSYIGNLLLKPLMPITFVLRQSLLFRVIYWIGAATWLLDVVDLGHGLST